MRRTSWWPRAGSGRLSVVGLDMGPTDCSLVVLSGTCHQPDTVCVVQRLVLPEGWVAHGEVLQPVALGQWLRTHLDACDYPLSLAYLGVDDACVSQLVVTLAAGLSPDDVAFQLKAEVQAMAPDQAEELCMDYRLDAEPAALGDQRYWVHTAPHRRVEVLARVAELAGLKAAVVEPRQEAIHRSIHHEALAALPQVSVALALQCGEAFGLALRAWNTEGVNFLPYRQDQQQALRRTWQQRLVACVMGGAFAAASCAMVLASAAQSQQPDASQVTAAAQAFDEAQKAHAQLKALHARRTEQTRWLQERQDLQSQSLRWSRVLSQSADGVWIAGVKQQNAHWVVQGEALSAQHAQQLVAQLKALDIWRHVPELPLLQVMPAVSATGLPVWQFRIEADLKVGG